MTKRLLIDASHAEETRVVVLDGNRLEDFDVETLSRRQLKGNIYLAKVVRVEPSLQAAFVEYGGNRHGFLAFGEIHPDYYQIPIADRQRLLAMQEEEARAEEEAEEDDGLTVPPPPTAEDTVPDAPQDDSAAQAQPLAISSETIQGQADDQAPGPDHQAGPDGVGDAADLGTDTAPEAAEPAQGGDADDHAEGGSRVRQIAGGEAPAPEMVGGETEVAEDSRPPRQPSRFMRSYKIQEVIRRRQILLIQVVKEERGTKGAALTTYISLAGRYCVLMPNSPRGGGISRKITSAADRRRLKEVTTELDIPRGMGLIVRTAGAARPKPEIKRDGEYLLRLWDDIRETTMRSMAPALIHEEASLIKRAIRDVYSRDVDELLVDGEDGWRAARDYMRMLMPTHVKKVQLWPSGAQPLFAHNQVESMLDSMLNPTVQLRSGGYLVINQTEALVAIDVNSGRSTRERGIEETALRTNLEAAEEAARQLRLRDLAGLIVIDFIDMESKKHNAMVERRMADALKTDRARIQIGHISHFGLLELSRQRLRPSLAETSLNVCAVCGGSGHVRSTESAALHVLREIEEEGGKRRAAEIMVHVASATALYILNNKRQRLTEIEARYGMRVCFAPDESLLAAQTRIEKLRAALPQDLPVLPAPQARPMPEDDAGEADPDDDEDDVEMGQTRMEAGASTGATPASDFTTDADHVPGETAAEGEQRRRRRRRRRRGGRREDVAAQASAPMPDGAEQPDIGAPATPASQDAEPPVPVPVPGHDGAAEAIEAPVAPSADEPALASAESEGEPGRAKRGRRGGRRRRKPGEENEASVAIEAEPAALVSPVYVGPTPADPFALGGMDIFDVLEQAEQLPASFVVAEAPQPPAEMDTRAEAEPAAQEATVLAETVVAEAPQPPVEISEPVAGPALQPVLVGSGEPGTAPKKGWWRR
jgi:ribonuclease E